MPFFLFQLFYCPKVPSNMQKKTMRVIENNEKLGLGKTSKTEIIN